MKKDDDPTDAAATGPRHVPPRSSDSQQRSAQTGGAGSRVWAAVPSVPQRIRAVAPPR